MEAEAMETELGFLFNLSIPLKFSSFSYKLTPLLEVKLIPTDVTKDTI